VRRALRAQGPSSTMLSGGASAKLTTNEVTNQ